MLNIILTSYNRPFFVERAVQSVLGQTSNAWRLIIQDDGSDEETVKLLRYYTETEDKIDLRTRTVAETTRQSMTRYSVLINEALEELAGGLVSYMCDNVEYDSRLVTTVVDWFERHPDQYAGYVTHHRDVWTLQGEYRSPASALGHWDYTPPRKGPIDRPLGMLDHSQVFHRLPTDLRWEEHVRAKKRGDGLFFTKLVREHGPIPAICPDVALTQEHLFS